MSSPYPAVITSYKSKNISKIWPIVSIFVRHHPMVKGLSSGATQAWVISWFCYLRALTPKAWCFCLLCLHFLLCKWRKQASSLSVVARIKIWMWGEQRHAWHMASTPQARTPGVILGSFTVIRPFISSGLESCNNPSGSRFQHCHQSQHTQKQICSCHCLI